MKNFKLLLATTAILSTGALLANATGTTGHETETVNFSIELVQARSLHQDQPIKFGRIVLDQDTLTLEAQISSEGIITSVGGNEGTHPYALDGAQKGIVSGATCEQLSYPSSTTNITPPSGNLTTKHMNIDCLTVEGKAIFYGDINMKMENNAPLPIGTYNGSFTVTAVYE